jgi:uncharacterized membrane protein YjfL (UPF0719 family)
MVSISYCVAVFPLQASISSLMLFIFVVLHRKMKPFRKRDVFRECNTVGSVLVLSSVT